MLIIRCSKSFMQFFNCTIRLSFHVKLTSLLEIKKAAGAKRKINDQALAASTFSHFCRLHPAFRRPYFQFSESLKSLIHRIQVFPELLNLAILYSQGDKQPTGLGVISDNLWENFVSPCFPHERTPPLTNRTMTNRTMTNPTKSRI